MRCKWILQGTVASGSQTAAHFTQLSWVREQCRDKLGFTPFPGTLNLIIEPDFFSVISKIRRADAIELTPPDSDGCSAKVIPLSIEGIKGCIIIPDSKVNIHGEQVIEVMAPVELRSSLGLQDGRQVTLWVDRPGEALLKAVIFDLDGTLLDSIGIYYKIVNMALTELGFPQVSAEQMKVAARSGEFEWEKVLPESVDVGKSDILEQIQSVVEKVYGPLFEIEALPIPGMKRAVDGLAAAGFKLGIVTSTPRENMGFKLDQLKRNGTLNHFAAVLASCDAPRKKPAPDPMIECCRQLGVALEHSVYIGDSKSDIESGKSAGMKTIGVLTGFDDLDTLSKERPDAVIASVAELKTVIDY